MKRYSAAQEGAKGRMTHRTAPGSTRTLLEFLNLPYSDGRRLVDRTRTKRYFRLSPGLATEIGIPVCDADMRTVDNESSPTELASVHDTLAGVTAYIGRSGLSIYQIADRLFEQFEEVKAPAAGRLYGDVPPREEITRLAA